MLWKSLSKLFPHSASTPASSIPPSFKTHDLRQNVTASDADDDDRTDLVTAETGTRTLPTGVPPPPPPSPPPSLPPHHQTTGQTTDHFSTFYHYVTPNPHQTSDKHRSFTHRPSRHWQTGKSKRTHATSKTSSVDENFNACKGQSCNDLKDRPLMESGATVYVVFGIKGVDRPSVEEGHVLDQFKGHAVFDSKFAQAFDLKALNPSHLSELCKICNILSNRTDLVKEGSAQCLPYSMYFMQKILKRIPECSDLPESLFIYHHQAPAHSEGGLDSQKRLIWLSFAFESTTSESQAYFEAYKQYEKWEALISHIKHEVLSPDSPLQSIFQTSEFWTKVLMEVVAVNSAIYGLVLSMIICIMAVAIFTGHLALLIIVVITITAVICCVVGVFYLAGWEMGAVEAVSLSILVGSSVDYCVHIVEGYILIGRRMSQPYLASQPKGALRKQRTSLAVRHIGVALVCSALTTIIAAVPLTQTYIQPFAKFGSILLINTTVSMVMTLTLAIALLAIFGPARYRGTWLSHLIAFLVVGGVIGLTALAIFIAVSKGATIPGPSGSPLFS